MVKIPIINQIAIKKVVQNNLDIILLIYIYSFYHFQKFRLNKAIYALPLRIIISYYNELIQFYF